MADSMPAKERKRTPRFEVCEPRIVMAADPLGPIQLDYIIESQIEQQQEQQIEQTLTSAHSTTGLDNARADYGFSGSGQTIAVIDTGIAWDHYALGGGFGQGYRVVGGYDFAENDAIPYDDGFAGAHGTHVAGIIGSTDAQNQGVAYGADLVSLRVFDDQGNGYFSWVEDALQWVHDHRNDFENPITAVNLSLGASWNSSNLPGWAMLEEEFAQLEADGIFIAVAAGNDFQSYNSPGLSYPAVSNHVVAVSSVTDSGQFSYFSQRHQRSIAAPGSSITSTVPDYIGNYNGQTDDWASFSGTSMASPYIAGSSALIRQAMEFTGIANITQDDIYQVMMDTADSFYDSATSAWYSRLNLESALDSIMPDDDYGSSLATAYGLGTLSDTFSTSGLIGKLDDSDFFEFTAAESGTVSITATATHGMNTLWSVDGAQASVTGDNGETVEFEVVAGQSYRVGISSNATLGYYDLEGTLTASGPAFTFTDLGAVTQSSFDDLNHAGDTWYRVESSRTGILTAETFFSHAGGNVDLEIYDEGLNLIDSSTGSGNSERIDISATSGETFYIKVLAANSDVDLRLTNLVEQSGNIFEVHGTTGNDTFTFSSDVEHEFRINGVLYSTASSADVRVTFHGDDGEDTAHVSGTSSNERGYLRHLSFDFASTNFDVFADGVENITLVGGGGEDAAYFYDSAGDDYYESREPFAEMTGSGYSNRAEGFYRTYAYASQGYDQAAMYDTAGDDTFRARSTHSTLQGGNYQSYTKDFERISAVSTIGNDRAYLYDSVGNDVFNAVADRYGLLYNSDTGEVKAAYRFGKVFGISTSGNDRAVFYDGSGDDIFRGMDNYSDSYGGNFYNYAGGFAEVLSFTRYGNDLAVFYDSLGDDEFMASKTYSQLRGNGFSNSAYGYKTVRAYSNHGNDTARLNDSVGNDMLKASLREAAIEGIDYLAVVRNFANVEAFASLGGNNQIDLDSVDYLFSSIGDWGMM